MNSKAQSTGINTIFQPETYLLVLITYSIGFSLVRYLGGDLDVLTGILGVILCWLILLTQRLLHAYFEHPDSFLSSLLKDDPEYEALKYFKRPMLLQFALLVLAAGAALTLVLLQRKPVGLSVLIFIGMALLFTFFSVVPPLRLEKQGFGELIETLFVAILVPAIGFSLQRADIPQLLVFFTLPIAFVYLAMKIVFNFRKYASDSALGRKSLTTLLGWQKALVLHNLLVLSAFILIGLFSLLGLPWSFTRGLLLALPIGGLQIYLMIRLGEGDRPRWALLTWVAAGLLMVSCYLVTVTMWIK